MEEVPTLPESPSQKGVTALTTTVVVCTRHRNDELKTSLSALKMMQARADQILVIDNSSGDPEAERIAAIFQADYVIEPIVGLSRARNRGFMESSGDVVFFLDDDATPDRGWLQEMLLPFDDPQVGLVTGRITSGTRIQTPPGDCIWRISRDHPHWLEIAAFGGLGSGANMAIRKSTCRNRHPFDERLGSGAPFEQGEENFAFAKLIKQGQVAVHVPSAIVYHPEKELELGPFAARSFAFWLLLLEEFPKERGILIQYLWSRIRRVPLPWPRNPQQAGVVISAGWRLYLRAGVQGALLYLRHRKGVR
jgi:glycosyltransferase involved in cell wall biosynthesis